MIFKDQVLNNNFYNYLFGFKRSGKKCCQSLQKSWVLQFISFQADHFRWSDKSFIITLIN